MGWDDKFLFGFFIYGNTSITVNDIEMEIAHGHIVVKANTLTMNF
jgi:hypothetical protein